MSDERWAQLRRERFPEIPEDCGNVIDPGMVYIPSMRDWSRNDTTYDQLRIERYIARYDLRQKRILHIGIGNSGLAQRFHTRVHEIVGVTVDNPEIDFAKSLRYENYSPILLNKYSRDYAIDSTGFDFIIDNNITSICCCMKHLQNIFEMYSNSLRPDGQIVTDRVGLGWAPETPGVNPRWKFDPEDLAAAGSVAGLATYRIDRNVLVLSHQAPPKFAYRRSPAEIASRSLFWLNEGRRIALGQMRKAARTLRGS